MIFFFLLITFIMSAYLSYRPFLLAHTSLDIISDLSLFRNYNFLKYSQYLSDTNKNSQWPSDWSVSLLHRITFSRQVRHKYGRAKKGEGWWKYQQWKKSVKWQRVPSRGICTPWVLLVSLNMSESWRCATSGENLLQPLAASTNLALFHPSFFTSLQFNPSSHF